MSNEKNNNNPKNDRVKSGGGGLLSGIQNVKLKKTNLEQKEKTNNPPNPFTNELNQKQKEINERKKKSGKELWKTTKTKTQAVGKFKKGFTKSNLKPGIDRHDSTKKLQYKNSKLNKTRNKLHGELATSFWDTENNKFSNQKKIMNRSAEVIINLCKETIKINNNKINDYEVIEKTVNSLLLDESDNDKFSGNTWKIRISTPDKDNKEVPSMLGLLEKFIRTQYFNKDKKKQEELKNLISKKIKEAEAKDKKEKNEKEDNKKEENENGNGNKKKNEKKKKNQKDTIQNKVKVVENFFDALLKDTNQKQVEITKQYEDAKKLFDKKQTINAYGLAEKEESKIYQSLTSDISTFQKNAIKKIANLNKTDEKIKKVIESRTKIFKLNVQSLNMLLDTEHESFSVRLDNNIDDLLENFLESLKPLKTQLAKKSSKNSAVGPNVLDTNVKKFLKGVEILTGAQNLVDNNQSAKNKNLKKARSITNILHNTIVERNEQNNSIHSKVNETANYIKANENNLEKTLVTQLKNDLSTIKNGLKAMFNPEKLQPELTTAEQNFVKRIAKTSNNLTNHQNKNARDLILENYIAEITHFYGVTKGSFRRKDRGLVNNALKVHSVYVEEFLSNFEKSEKLPKDNLAQLCNKLSNEAFDKFKANVESIGSSLKAIKSNKKPKKQFPIPDYSAFLKATKNLAKAKKYTSKLTDAFIREGNKIFKQNNKQIKPNLLAGAILKSINTGKGDTTLIENKLKAGKFPLNPTERFIYFTNKPLNSEKKLALQEYLTAIQNHRETQPKTAWELFAESAQELANAVNQPPESNSIEEFNQLLDKQNEFVKTAINALTEEGVNQRHLLNESNFAKALKDVFQPLSNTAIAKHDLTTKRNLDTIALRYEISKNHGRNNNQNNNTGNNSNSNTNANRNSNTTRLQNFSKPTGKTMKEVAIDNSKIDRPYKGKFDHDKGNNASNSKPVVLQNLKRADKLSNSTEAESSTPNRIPSFVGASILAYAALIVPVIVFAPIAATLTAAIAVAGLLGTVMGAVLLGKRSNDKLQNEAGHDHNHGTAQHSHSHSHSHSKSKGKGDEVVVTDASATPLHNGRVRNG